MTIYTWIGIPILMAGVILILASAPKSDALAGAGLPPGKHRIRHGIGVGLAVFGCVLMNFGALTSDVPGVLKVMTGAAAVMLLGVVVRATAKVRKDNA
ncbi:hypothetical protein ABIC28_005096 [Rhodococcus sp. PvR044]|uniref:hypothetical protein n=1 Tax=Rhodococcus sp. PvR044 TaxID=3156402 RepID=UPI00339772D3